MTGPRFDDHRMLRLTRNILESRDDRAGGNRLFGEEIGGSNQNSDFHAFFSQWLRHHGHHRAAHRIVDASGKDNVHFGRFSGREVRGQDDADHGLPKDEARPGADMTPTLTAFKNKPTRAFANECFQDAR